MRTSVLHEMTLPETPEQNGKQENFWKQIDSRLMPMLEGVEPLTLRMLNEATQAWIECEYNQAVHSETGQRAATGMPPAYIPKDDSDPARDEDCL